MVNMSSIPFTLIAIDPAVADALRAVGGPGYVADTNPGYPCRQCLRDADVGDELILVSYDPFEDTASPYRCASPIFLHREPCLPYDDDHRTDGQLPTQLTSRSLSVRAFDADAMMIDAALIEGTSLDDTIDRLLANGDVDHLHVHNASRGCFAARVDRRADHIAV